MFRGLMPAMVTPFDERGEVDLEATEAVVERFIRGWGGRHLSFREHRRVLTPHRR
jgi:hypothetical protein